MNPETSSWVVVGIFFFLATGIAYGVGAHRALSRERNWMLENSRSHNPFTIAGIGGVEDQVFAIRESELARRVPHEVLIRLYKHQGDNDFDYE